MKFLTKDELKDLYLKEGLASFNNYQKELIDLRKELMSKMYTLLSDEEILRFFVQNALLSGTVQATSAVLLPLDPELIEQMLREVKMQLRLISFIKSPLLPILQLYKV